MIINESGELAILNEAYFQKSKNLLEAEKILQECADALVIHNQSFAHSEQKARIAKVEELLEKQFNVENFCLEITNVKIPHDLAMKIAQQVGHDVFVKKMEKGVSMEKAEEDATNQARNVHAVLETRSGLAFTMPTIDSHLFDDEPIEKTSDGYRFASKRLYLPVFISSDLFKGMSGGQILAVILHETGHQFFCASAISRIAKIIVSCMSVVALIIFVSMSKIPDAVLSVLRKIGLGAAIDGIVNFVIRMADDFTTFYNAVLEFQGAIDVLKNLSTVLSTVYSWTGLKSLMGDFLLKGIVMGSYNEEEFADKFAVIHGYGAELSMAWTTGIVIRDRRVWGAPFGLMSNLSMTVNCIANGAVIADVHPQFRTRITQAIATLEDEKKRTTNPKLRKCIDRDIRQAQLALRSFDNKKLENMVIDLSAIDKVKKFLSDLTYSDQHALVDKREDDGFHLDQVAKKVFDWFKK
jgi:hypothetical protein